ncbi:hypothetical protein [Rhodoligotrophos defluvii]|uniref:hypothetical protein n=1 Tax=Rhodoligotrophos defluvii TaxID=2561934 RepID=UPI0010C93CF1|nr:hypothetical protein [Rhodoligotrophos defluvii]
MNAAVAQQAAGGQPEAELSSGQAAAQAPDRRAGASSQPTPAALPAQPMTGRMLRALFPGKFEAVWKNRRTLIIGADADGRLKGYSDGKYDAGRWEISGNKLCISFAVWTGGDRKCGEVYRGDGWFMGLLNKKGEAHLRFRKR